MRSDSAVSQCGAVRQCCPTSQSCQIGLSYTTMPSGGAVSLCLQRY